MTVRIAAIALFTAAVTAAAPAFADHKAQEAAREVIPLSSGETLYIFKDGKMAKADQFGRAAFLKIGETLRTADGRVIKATSNEVAHLTSLLAEDYSGD